MFIAFRYHIYVTRSIDALSGGDAKVGVVVEAVVVMMLIMMIAMIIIMIRIMMMMIVLLLPLPSP